MVLRTCVPTLLGINFHPPAFENASYLGPTDSMPPARLLKQPTFAPGLKTTVPFYKGTANKSLTSYSLKAKGAVRQRVAANGQFRGSNGRKGNLGGYLGAGWRGLLMSDFRPERSTPDVCRNAKTYQGESYSFRTGRSTAITKCAKCEAPSSSCSQRTTQ